ncbi:MAG: EAL domain-containing protein, partial [Halothiobacillaceae bacterium]
IVTQAIQRCARQVIAAPDATPIHHFLNISTDLLRHPRRIEAILAAARLFAEQCGMLCSISKPLVIEITERELVGDPREALEILRPFLDFGLKIAVDDFGSGYSSRRSSTCSTCPSPTSRSKASWSARCARNPRRAPSSRASSPSPTNSN